MTFVMMVMLVVMSMAVVVDMRVVIMVVVVRVVMRSIGAFCPPTCICTGSPSTTSYLTMSASNSGGSENN